MLVNGEMGEHIHGDDTSASREALDLMVFQG